MQTLFTTRPLASYLRDGKFVSRVVIAALTLLLFWNLIALVPSEAPQKADADAALKRCQCFFSFFFLATPTITVPHRLHPKRVHRWLGGRH